MRLVDVRPASRPFAALWAQFQAQLQRGMGIPFIPPLSSEQTASYLGFAMTLPGLPQHSLWMNRRYGKHNPSLLLANRPIR